MNFEQLEGKWKQYKGQVREKWGHLTDDDLQVIAGKRDKLIGRIQERYGIARERASEEVDAFMRTLHDQPVHNNRDPDETSDEERGARAKSHTAGGR
jgi:uncharacterized protein YjbJ (UPF0337 family)